jgi:hypothetical protein
MKNVGCDLHTRYQQSKLRLGGAVDLFHHKRDVRAITDLHPQSVRRYLDSAPSRTAPVSRDERISGRKLFTAI